jgi:glutathione S-transferase
VNLTYVELEEARKIQGLRLVLSKGVPGPWGEAAKAIFNYKSIDFAAVAHLPLQDNSLVAAWTGVGNAPVAMYNSERPRSGWVEILLLAERLTPEPGLIPSNEEDRARMFGIAHAICSEDGFGWNRRITMLHIGDERAERKGRDNSANAQILQLKHRYRDESDIGVGIRRTVDILDFLASVLQKQRQLGSPWFVGNHLTAADIYWAAFSNMVAPLSPDICPMPEFYRDINSDICDAERKALAPILIEHRDRVIRDHFKLPMSF